MRSRRSAAVAALVLSAGFGVAIVVGAAGHFPRGLVAGLFLVIGCVVLWEAIRRRGPTRPVLLVVATLLFVGFVVALVAGGILLWVIAAAALLVLAVSAGRAAFLIRAPLPAAEPPRYAVVVWNPRSGGGKALEAHLAEEARARGITPIELRPGDDLMQLVRDAVAAGADALAAAGGDGTQALVAAVAAEHDLPFACIPAGTRNHFALDLGVDRDDVVGALDAFVDGGERRVDLAEVNGRVFVNNASLGLYAEAVQRRGYRDAKLRTIVDTVPDFGGAAGTGVHDLVYDGGGRADGHAVMVMVSNNSYRLGRLIGSGTRPRLDGGRLGIAVLEATAEGRRPRLRQWEASRFTVDSSAPVAAGVDGEALTIDPPLRFAIRPAALRVRIAPQHPGASPSAAQPDGLVEALRRLVRIAREG